MTIAKHRLPIVALLTANTVSMVGNVLTMLAVPWFVLETTGSATKTGITGFFAALPVVIAAFFGGVIVDRLGFKRVSIIADVTSGVCVALVPLLYHTTGLAFWQLLVLVFAGAFLDAPGTTARQSLLPDLAGQAEISLERANAAYQAIQRFSALAGPPLAGGLIVLFGASNVLWIDAATFVFSATLIALAVPKITSAERSYLRYRTEVLEGLRFITRSRLMLSIVITIAITNFLDSPLFAVIMPVYANKFLRSAADLGVIFGGFGAGSLAGALIYGAIGRRLPRRGLFIGTFIAVGLPFWLMATLPPLPVMIGATFMTGLAAGPINPLLMTIAQEKVPKEMRGRVFGMFSGLAYIAMPLGILACGFVVEGLGPGINLAIIAACYLLVTLVQFFNPALKDMAARKAGESHRPAEEPSIAR